MRKHLYITLLVLASCCFTNTAPAFTWANCTVQNKGNRYLCCGNDQSNQPVIQAKDEIYWAPREDGCSANFRRFSNCLSYNKVGTYTADSAGNDTRHSLEQLCHGELFLSRNITPE